MTTRLSPPAASEDFAARVLIVDDNPTNLQVLLQTLDGRGHELLAATNGEDALRIAGTEHPALVLLDVMMPGIDGYEVCRRLKANPATEQSAVIFLSALGDVEDRVRGARFFKATLMLFLLRVRPASRQRNPPCIRNTNPAQTRTQKISSSVLSTASGGRLRCSRWQTDAETVAHGATATRTYPFVQQH